jgi:hypothetical protein
MKRSIGFDKLNNIKPDTDDMPQPSVKSIDEIAQKHGFTSREATERLYKHSGPKEPTIPLSLRPPISVGNRFISYCKHNRFSYHEGLDELMKKAGI